MYIYHKLNPFYSIHTELLNESRLILKSKLLASILLSFKWFINFKISFHMQFNTDQFVERHSSNWIHVDHLRKHDAVDSFFKTSKRSGLSIYGCSIAMLNKREFKTKIRKWSAWFMHLCEDTDCTLISDFLSTVVHIH